MTCRRCSECQGETHHWLMICAVANEGGDVVVPCKHCDETTVAVDCEACGEMVPAATAHLCTEDSTWLCQTCSAEILADEARS